jgi:hypothetical protein
MESPKRKVRANMEKAKSKNKNLGYVENEICKIQQYHKKSV